MSVSRYFPSEPSSECQTDWIQREAYHTPLTSSPDHYKPCIMSSFHEIPRGDVLMVTNMCSELQNAAEASRRRAQRENNARVQIHATHKYEREKHHTTPITRCQARTTRKSRPRGGAQRERVGHQVSPTSPRSERLSRRRAHFLREKANADHACAGSLMCAMFPDSALLGLHPSFCEHADRETRIAVSSDATIGARID